MKKILSLLALLVTTVTSMAADYTDVLKFTLNIMGDHSATQDAGTLTIEDNGDGTYDVIAKNADFGDYGNYGNITCTYLEPTSVENGITTIEVTEPSCSCTAGNTMTGTSLKVKFNDEKAWVEFEGKINVMYVNRTFKYTFGTDDFSTGGGETPVVEEYPINFDKSATHSRNDRITSSISLQQEGKEKQTISTTPYKLYEDLTAQSFTVEAGSEVTPTFDFSGVWMNGYVYIDRDNDKQFSYKEGQWDQAGTDLVAYSFYSTLANPKVNDGNGYNSIGASVTGDDRSNVNPPAFTAPTEPGTYRIRFKIDWNCILPGGSSDIRSDGGGIWDATLVVEEAQAPTPTVVAEKTFTDAISIVGDDFSTELGQATVTVKEMSDETINMTLSVTSTEGTTEYTASGFTKTVDTDKNRTTYEGTLNIEGEDFNVNALVYTENEEEKLYLVATSYFKYVIGTDPDYVAPVTEVSNKNYTSNLRIYDADAEEPVNVVEKDEAVVNIVKNSDDTYKVTLKNIAWGEHAATDLVFVGSADAGIMSGKLDGEEETEQDVSIMAVPDDATAAVLGEGVQAMFQWIEKAEDAIEMAFYLQVGTTTYAGEFNYEKETPEEPVTVVSEKTFTDKLYMVGDDFNAEVGEGTVNVKEMSDETINMTIAFTTEEGTTELTATGVTKTVDADKNRTTYTGKLTIEEEDFDVNALVYTEAEAEKLYMVATGSYFNYVIGTNPDAPETPDTPNVTKVVEDGYAPAGEKFSFPFSCDFNTQKLVWEVDFTNAGSQANQLVFTIGTSDADLSKWETPTGGNAHFYYTKQTTGNKLVLHYLHSGKRVDVDNIAVDNVATFTLDAEGFHVGDKLAVTADQMPKLYEGGTDFLFGSQEGSGRSNAVYNYVEVRPLDATEPTEVSNKSYTSNLRIYDADSEEEEPVNVVEKDEAVVNIVKYSDDTYKVTLKDIAWGEHAATDLVFVGSADAGIMSGKLDGEDATDQGVSIMAVPDDATAAVLGEGVMAMFQWIDKAEDAIEMAFYLQIGTTTYAGEFNYEKETPEKPVTVVTEKTFTDKLYMVGDDFNAEVGEGTVNVKEMSDETINMTVAFTTEEGTTELTTTGVTKTVDADKNRTTYTGKLTIEEEDFDVNALVYTEGETEKLYMVATGSYYKYVIGTNPDATTPEEPEVFCKENYVADGTGFEWDINVDWDTQKIVMSIDPSTCTGSCEHIIGLGASPTTFSGNLMLYRTSADNMLQGYFQTSAGNNNTGKFAETNPFLVEVSKAQGFVVNDEVKIAASSMSDLFTLSTVKMGTGEGSNDLSRATYNYVKVVDKDWTAPKDPETGIGAIEAAYGDAQIFTVNGVKLNNLQKGLNIVRTADGKVKKVLVK